jgi:hypothetical protein
VVDTHKTLLVLLVKRFGGLVPSFCGLGFLFGNPLPVPCSHLFYRWDFCAALAVLWDLRNICQLVGIFCRFLTFSVDFDVATRSGACCAVDFLPEYEGLGPEYIYGRRSLPSKYEFKDLKTLILKTLRLFRSPHCTR